MQWRDFAPFVMPYVVGCPMPTLEHHAMLTSNDWFRRTLCLKMDLDPEFSTGASNAIDIVPPSRQLAVVRVLSVQVGDCERELLTMRDGQRFVRSQHPGAFCFAIDSRTLMVYPLEPAGVPVIVTAALAPAVALAEGVDDDIATEHMGDIAQGIIASIKMLPGQGFSDSQGAIAHRALYEDRIRTIAAKVARGESAAKLRSAPRMF